MAAFGLVLLDRRRQRRQHPAGARGGSNPGIAIRLSVGATRGRIIQQLLTESAIIALAGALCGSLLFWWSFQALIPWLLTSVPGGEAFRSTRRPIAPCCGLRLD